MVQKSFCPLNGYARPVSDDLIHSGELVEGCTLSNVCIPGKDDDIIGILPESKKRRSSDLAGGLHLKLLVIIQNHGVGTLSTM